MFELDKKVQDCFGVTSFITVSNLDNRTRIILNDEGEQGVPEVIELALSLLERELYHVRQYQNVVNLVNYGLDPQGNVTNSCIYETSCRGVLWQYIGTRVPVYEPQNNYFSNPSEYTSEIVNNSGLPSVE